MTKPPPAHFRLSDLRALARLAADGTAEVSEIAEALHASILSTMGLARGPRGRTRGLTGFVYAAVRRVARRVSLGIERGLSPLERFFGRDLPSHDGTFEREALVAALNGVVGDHLAASQNPLATPMTFRHRGQKFSVRPFADGSNGSNGSDDSDAQRRVVLFIHGLCMNDLQWRGADGDSYADDLVRSLGITPLFLRYNTGLHISQNGALLSRQLEELVGHWPVPLEELAIIAHSMGGLVVRSAFAQARREGLRWPDRLKKLVFLGTPHHGAPLERGGNWIDVVLAATRFSAPFAKLGKLRSAGITDLRFGLLNDEDWRGRDRFEHKADDREISRLPEGVACFAVAATTAREPNRLVEHTLGDGLVPLASALGEHADSRRTLAFPADSTWIAYGTNHLGMLHSPEISQRILGWLKPEPANLS